MDDRAAVALRSSYTPAVAAAGAGIALYVLSKIGELIVILLVWSAYATLAYAALYVVAAPLGVSLFDLIKSAADRARDFARPPGLRERSLTVLRGRP